jgi:hypothetical protein
MSHKPILSPIVEIKVPQAKLKKEGQFLRQTLDDSHVSSQRGEDGTARQFPNANPKGRKS